MRAPPGHDLCQYLDANGEHHTVSSSDINDYLHDITGADFTAKDYRTWAGSVFALAALRKLAWETVTEARKHVVGTIKEVSKILRNTPAVCRKCYVHPAVIEAFEAGELAGELPPSRRSGLKSDEAMLAVFLEKDAKRRAREAARGRKSQANGADPRLARLLAKSSQKAQAAALKNSSKDVRMEALAAVSKAAAPKTASTVARPATRKIARVRSSTAVSIS